MKCANCGDPGLHACTGHYPVPPKLEGNLSAIMRAFMLKQSMVAHMADAPALPYQHPNLPAPEAVDE